MRRTQSVLRHRDTLRRDSAVGLGRSLADSLRTNHVGSMSLWPGSGSGSRAGLLTAGCGLGSHGQMRYAGFYQKAVYSFFLTISLSPTVYFSC